MAEQRLKTCTVELVEATADQIAGALLAVDPGKAAHVAAIIAKHTAAEDGPISQAFAAADANPAAALGRLFEAFVGKPRRPVAGAVDLRDYAKPAPSPPQIAHWEYEDPT